MDAILRPWARAEEDPRRLGGQGALAGLNKASGPERGTGSPSGWLVGTRDQIKRDATASPLLFELLQPADRPFCASGSNSLNYGYRFPTRCPSALFYDQRSIPRRGLVELRQFRRSIGLLVEFCRPAAANHRPPRGRLGGLPADHQWQLYAFAKSAGHYGIRFNGAWVDIGALAPVQLSTIRSIRVIFPHGHDNSDRLVRLDI
jgi:hypothetical protein